jgi:hypothetical protein
MSKIPILDDKAREGTGAIVQSADPWKHRAKGMRCASCMWWVAKPAPPLASENGPLGRCRRHAPTMSGYPATFGLDWCGDHKLDENKV